MQPFTLQKSWVCLLRLSGKKKKDYLESGKAEPQMRVGVLIAHSEPSCWQTLEDRCMCPAPLPATGMSAYQEKLTPNYRGVVSVFI